MLTKSLKSRVATASMSAALTVTGALHAQPEGNASAADRERAIELFREARRLQEQGRPAEACELFRRSASLLPGPGILLNLGQCLEREGNAIGALETYERALAVARAHATASPEQRAAWVNEARRGMDSQQRHVAEVQVAAKATPGLRVTLDGQPITPGDTPHRVAPGQHQLAATAPGRIDFASEVELRPGETLRVLVPELQHAAAPASPSLAAPSRGAPPEPAPAAREGSSTLPWVLAGTGAAFIGAGVVTGILTTSKAAELEKNCPDSTCPAADREPGWQDEIDASRRLALVTNVLWGVGLASAGVGIALLVFGADESEREATPPALDAGCTGDGCGVLLRGRF